MKLLPHTRRQFLHAAAGTIASAALAASSRPSFSQSTAPARKIGYAIVGLGRLTMGEILPAFAACQHSRPAALVSGHPDKAARVAEQYHIDPRSIYTYENYDQLKDNPGVDAVYIALPNSMHAEYTIRAARAGKHVFCEKPMANTVEECRQMIDACDAAKVKLMIGYRLRHEPHTTWAIEVCRGNKLGPIRFVTAIHSFNIAHNQWRLDKKLAGGGPLVDIGIYCLNAARYLTGEEPTEITATLTAPKDDPRFREVEESIAFMLKFPSGALANCSSSYSHGYASRCSAYFRSGTLDIESAFAYGGLDLRINSAGHDARALNPAIPQINQFAREIEHFSDCILSDKLPITPGAEGLQDVKLIRAIYQAAETGKAVQL
jgi:predicted dehydrogenase